uniref:Uncharacterized protein n=1 Tax=Candidatus Kentrum sp. SD TaxID=2126332 RepID=A0A450Z0Q8_9GAMM|nr:MAG: hypothetical protein BECKSD772F_GA0070984_10776 [Candidatus Kentron sp. SD]VFK47360.1 MAG: hypothetical protein BECKSD772E_GA0070983_109314 [Candidatus Kentron sp. SD]VFK80052.1 MAG: hypothetical protein BECKSD772D_GA0070982_10825 [Candidatus Kentron sp. SD]
MLDNGNLVVASPYDDTVATDSGAARLYRPDGALLATLSGTTANDKLDSGALRRWPTAISWSPLPTGMMPPTA